MRLIFNLSLFLCFSVSAQYSVRSDGDHKRNPASMAADSDYKTAWVSSKRGPQVLTYDLKEEKNLKGFVYIPFLFNASGRVEKYSIEISLDEKNWQEVNKGIFSYPSGINVWPDRKDKIIRIKLDQEIKARFFRLNIHSTINNAPARISEFLPVIDEEPFRSESMGSIKGYRYAPSIHLSYQPSLKAQLFYNEIEVTESVHGSFFMAIGFNQGYFGIQETNQGKKWFLFSIWDSHSHDKNAQIADKRVKVIHQDPKTRAQRFGGEGSGGQSFYDYDWKVGERVKFCLKIEDKDDRRHYSAYIYLSQEKRWVHMLTFASIAPQPHLSRFHSFVEDFKRDFDSFHKHRGMKVYNSWIKDLDGNWHYAADARFTRDGNPHTNITAFIDKDAFYFGTGGKVEKEVSPGTRIKREVKKTPPTNLPF